MRILEVNESDLDPLGQTGRIRIRLVKMDLIRKIFEIKINSIWILEIEIDRIWILEVKMDQDPIKNG
jgi:hypothetical protein